MSKPENRVGRTALYEPRSVLIVAAAAVVVLVVQVAASPAVYVYDEHYHIAGARLLVDGTSIYTLLRTPLESAAGPLYPLLHALLAPLTHLQAPAIAG